MKIVSGCLVGINCKYNGKNNKNNKIFEIYKKGQLIPVCPEQLGGLSTPREPAETTGDGLDVLKGKAKVLTISGKDVTSNFIRGAKEVLKIAKDLNIKEAILKSKSPSCGYKKIYDGTFSKKLINGNGVLAALLEQNKIKIYTEKEFEK
ncbi:MAG: DUF523 domain-containing protein [Candidatus Aenigmarchaeota archaeon]|nr:DUF523 domain-containing protein [Candidatus Aenigmarchaeota archaeon]